jgi:hypothetical protein
MPTCGLCAFYHKLTAKAKNFPGYPQKMGLLSRYFTPGTQALTWERDKGTGGTDFQPVLYNRKFRKELSGSDLQSPGTNTETTLYQQEHFVLR